MHERRPATTIPELDVHLGYVQQALKELQGAVENMATKQDITRLAERMNTFATKEELARLEAKLDGETTESKLKRMAGLATSIMSIIALCVAVWAGVTYVVHAQDAIEARAKP